MYAQNRLYVDAYFNEAGALVISGQDLNVEHMGYAEYEYVLTVSPTDIPTIVAALDGAPEADVLDLLERNGGALVRAGERTWLRGLGIEPGFWNRIDPL